MSILHSQPDANFKPKYAFFREEEWLKVLCHESFHNLGLDFISIDTTYLQEANAQVKNIFPVNVDDLRVI